MAVLVSEEEGHDSLLKDMTTCWRTWQLAEGHDNLLKVMTTCWRSWQLSEGHDKLLKDMTTCWRTWQLAEGHDNFLKAMTTFWRTWQLAEGHDNLLKDMTTCWRPWQLALILFFQVCLNSDHVFFYASQINLSVLYNWFRLICFFILLLKQDHNNSFCLFGCDIWSP